MWWKYPITFMHNCNASTHIQSSTTTLAIKSHLIMYQWRTVNTVKWKNTPQRTIHVISPGQPLAWTVINTIMIHILTAWILNNIILLITRSWLSVAQASSAFKCFSMYMIPTQATIIFIALKNTAHQKFHALHWSLHCTLGNHTTVTCNHVNMYLLYNNFHHDVIYTMRLLEVKQQFLFTNRTLSSTHKHLISQWRISELNNSIKYNTVICFTNKMDTNYLFINKNNCRSQLIFATRNYSLIIILLMQIQPSIPHYKCYFTVHNRCWKKRNRHLLYKVTSVSVQGISNPVTCASNLFWSYKTM